MKTQINARLILASHNAATNDRLYTFVLTMPKYLVGELNTHRAFGRNSASSRAISAKKMRSRIVDDQFTPTHFPAEQKGMAGGEDITGWRASAAELAWNLPRYAALVGSWALSKLGVHKQIGNRLTEPWMWTQVLVTATDWKNFLALRNHDAAEPHIHDLAKMVDSAICKADRLLDSMLRVSIRSMFLITGEQHRVLQTGELHLPFITQADRDAVGNDQEKLKKISAARSARVSYYLPDGTKASVEKDLEFADRLASSGHWSPFEHCATAISASSYVGHLRGFRPYRKEFQNEHGGDRA